MNQYSKLEVIDKDGWRNEFRLEKTIVHIGSDPRNDIVLEQGRGGHVAPLHAQLILSASQKAPADKASGCQLVNLGDTDIRLGLSADQTVPPRAVISLTHGAAFKLGEFTLIFHGDESRSDIVTSSDQRVGLSMSLPRTRLEPNRTLDGVITVSNLGDRGGVQIELDLEGLEPDCYDLEPGPILSSGAEREVFFRLHHRGHKPRAGDCPITIRATAPHAYPGDEVIVSHVVQVLPFYCHKLHLVPPAGVSLSLPAEEREGSAVDVGLSQPQAEDGRRPQDGAGLPSVPGKGTGAEQAFQAKLEQPARVAAPPPAETGMPAPTATEQASQSGVDTPAAAKENWRTRLIQAFSFHRSKPSSSQAVKEVMPKTQSDWLPPLEGRSTSAAEVIPQPQAEERQTETDLPAQFPPEVLPAAEDQAPEAAAAAPVQMEDEEVTSAGPPEGEVETVSLEEPQAEPETELSVQSPAVELPIEEEQWPEIEVPAPDQVADEEIASIGYLREEGEAISQEEPQAEAETELPAQLPDEESPPEEEQAPEAEPAATVQPEDLWWTTPEDPLRGTAEDGLEQHVLKLKASPPPEAQAVQTPIEAEPPPSAEDWWASGAEVGRGEASDDRPVLKLKASPPPETEAEQMPDEAEPSPSAEDWWTPPTGPLLGEPAAGSGEETEERPVPELKAGLPSATDVEQVQETELDTPPPET